MPKVNDATNRLIHTLLKLCPLAAIFGKKNPLISTSSSCSLEVCNCHLTLKVCCVSVVYFYCPRVAAAETSKFKEIPSKDTLISSSIKKGKVNFYFSFGVWFDPAKGKNFCKVWIGL